MPGVIGPVQDTFDCGLLLCRGGYDGRRGSLEEGHDVGPCLDIRRFQ